MEKIKYAIFDVDGTLLDSMHIWDTVAGAFLMMNGIIPQEENLFRKQGYATGVKYMIERYNLKFTYDEIRGHIDDILRFYYAHSAEVKPGVIDFLKALKANGTKITIATATDRTIIEIALKRLGLSDYIDKIFCSREVGKSKEFPDMFDACREFMQAGNDDVFVFEDALYSIKTAKKYGYKTVCIEDYSAGEDTLELKKTADYYVTDYSELYKIFDI